MKRKLSQSDVAAEAEAEPSGETPPRKKQEREEEAGPEEGAGLRAEEVEVPAVEEEAGPDLGAGPRAELVEAPAMEEEAGPEEGAGPRAGLAEEAAAVGDAEWDARAWRGGPRGPGSGGKGRSRRSRERNTNWRVPAGHERKIAAKIRASRAKRRRRQRPGAGPRSSAQATGTPNF